MVPLGAAGGYAEGVTTVLHLPDEVAALLEKRASQRGLTLMQFVAELARPPRYLQALEEFIGCAEVEVDAPFDIHQARIDAADDLLGELEGRNPSRIKGSSRSAGRGTV